MSWKKRRVCQQLWTQCGGSWTSHFNPTSLSCSSRAAQSSSLTASPGTSSICEKPLGIIGGDGLVGRLVFTEISLCAKGTWATQKHKPWLIPLATPVLLSLIILVLFQVQHQLQGHLLRQCHKESNCEFWFPVAGKVVLSYFNGMAVVSSPDCYVELLE